jgi:hypothetical protein
LPNTEVRWGIGRSGEGSVIARKRVNSGTEDKWVPGYALL